MNQYQWLRFRRNGLFHWATRITSGVGKPLQYRTACGKTISSHEPDSNPSGLQRLMTLCPKCQGQMSREGRRVMDGQ